MRLLESIHNYDVLTFGWCLRRKHREQVVGVSRFLSRTGDGPLYFLIGAASLMAHEWNLAKLLAIGYSIERLCYFIFKSSFKRNRPPAAIPGYRSEVEPSDQFSFPSGHTSAAFLMAGCLTYTFPWAAWFLYPWACSVGFARVMLGVHFPTDTLAGAILGSSICYILIGLLF